MSNSFDFMRVLAASVVLFSHSFPLYGLVEPRYFMGKTLGDIAVAYFFAISGYLISQSWSRDPSIYRYSVRRFLRIFPGLIAATLFTMLFIGALNTRLNLVDYFTHGATWKYAIKTICLFSVPSLPGVFENNFHANANNGSLWTLRYEVLMYLIMAGVGCIFSGRKLKLAPPSVFLLFAIGWFYVDRTWGANVKVSTAWSLGIEFYWDRILMLGAYFFSGACLSLWKHNIKLSIPLSLLLMLLAFHSDNRLATTALLWVAIPYSAISFAFNSSRIFHLPPGNDYSYGIYIYGFPVQQALSTPLHSNGFSWITYLVAGFFITLFLAWLSWNFIEKPALGIKNHLIPERKTPY